jgi:hypothetical protein
MMSVRTLAALGVSLALGACADGPPPGPAAIVLPGQGKTEAAFQQDETICRQHAISHTGYGDLSQPPRASAPVPATGPAASPGQPSQDVSFMQCMAARGDTVQMQSSGGYPYGYDAPYPYSYAYGYGYGYPYLYPDYDVVFGGVGFFHHGFFRGGFHHGGFHGAGFHGGGFHGGGHGGGGHR